MKILIGADIVPTPSNRDEFTNGNADVLCGRELRSVLANADYRIFNLEVPLVEEPNEIEKCGPHLIANPDAITGLKALGVDLFTLGNNHIMDQGEKGLTSTICTLEKAHISYTGVGKNLEEAHKPFSFEMQNEKIGIYACAEHEFSIATDEVCGANPFDCYESFDQVAALKENCDYVIVLYHGGKEHYRYPTPNLQKVCRKFVEKGADLIVCQHSHCIGCTERWKNGNIVYGQGNFIFDEDENEFWATSMLIDVDTVQHTINFVPLVRKNNGVRLADEKKSAEILSAFFTRSSEIQHPGFVTKKFDEEVSVLSSDVLSSVCGRMVSSLPFRAINRLTGGALRSKVTSSYLTQKMKMRIINLVECETWREVLLASLKNYKQ